MTHTEATTTTEAAVVAEQGAPVAPEKASSKKGASQKKGAPKAKKTAKAAAPKKEAKTSAKKQAKPANNKAAKAATKPEKGQPRQGSKKQIILDLLRRKDGATMAEIAKATGGWQKHSIRGFVSGTLMKKMELPVESFKNEQGERTYRLAE